MITIEEAMTAVNGNGWFQLRTAIATSVIQFIGPLFIVALPFLMEELDVKDCVIDPDAPETITKEFELVCDREYFIVLTSTAYFIGMLVGAPLMSSVADRYGRKTAWKYGLCGVFLGYATAAGAFGPEMLVGAGFLLGMFNLGTTLAGFVLINELVDPMVRNWYSAGLMSCWAVACMILYWLLWAVPQWRFIFGLGVAGALLGLCFVPCLLESPKFLLYNRNQPAEAKAVLRRIAAVNSRECPSKDLMQTHAEDASDQLSYLALIKQSSFRTKFLIVTYLWTTTSLVYYGLILLVNDNFGNKYIKGTLLAFSEFIADLLCAVCLNRLGRRKTAISVYAAAAACAFFVFCYELGHSASGLLEVMNYLALFLVRFCISVAFVLIYVYTGELFPTNIRSRAFGASNFLSRLGTALCPILVETSQSLEVPPIGVFAALLVVAGLLALFLQETLVASNENKSSHDVFNECEDDFRS